MRWLIYTTALLGIISPASSSFAGHRAVLPKETVTHHIQCWANFLNTFKTFGELLDTYEKMGILMRDEKAGILSDLQKKDVFAKTRLPRFTAKNNMIYAGKAGWELEPKLSYKTNRGRLIHPDNVQSMAGVFEKAIEALNEPTRSALNQLLLPSAYAQSATDTKDTMASGLGLVGEHAMRAIFGDLLMPVSAGVFGLGAALTDNTYWPLRNWLATGKVTCVNGLFVADLGSKGSARATEEQLAEAHEYCQRDIASHDSDAIMSGHFQSECEFVSKLLNYTNNVFSRSAQTIVSRDALQRALGDGSARCTEANKEKVAASLKQNLEAVRTAGPAENSGPIQPVSATTK